MLMDLGLVALIGRVIVFMILDFIGHIDYQRIYAAGQLCTYA